jgi:phosphoglycolate phosphatase-like HAD superfamily hydrolase
MPRLLLFDIDGTLVDSNRTGRIAVGRALDHVFGTAGAVTTYDFAGKTDRRIVRDLMAAEGYTPAEIERRFPAFVERMAVEGGALFTPDRVRPCPGVLPLLMALEQRDDAVLGLLTGNVISTAPLKLQAAGIDPTIFRAGAYGSDRLDRNDLMPVALERVYDAVGQRFPPEDVVILGDTPADIHCARAANARVVAVATGPVPYDVLRDHKPDHLFADFLEASAVLAAIFDSEDRSVL